MQNKKLWMGALVLLCLANAAVYSAYYLVMLYVPDVLLLYSVHFAVTLLQMALPVLFSGITLLFFLRNRPGRGALWLMAFSFSSLFYHVPMQFSLADLEGYDTLGCLTLGLGTGVLYALLLYGSTLALAFLSKLLYRRRVPPGAPLSLEEGGLFDLHHPLQQSMLIPSVAVFVYFLAGEILTLVDYLTEAAGSYAVSEILYSAFSFLFLLAALLCSHGMGVYIVRRLAREKKTEA